MKNKLLLALALLCAYFVGCGDYDESVDNPLYGSAEKEAVIDMARYTVIIYGISGGDMDSIIEGAYEQMKPLMKNKDVRVYVTYKYGTDSSAVGYDEDENPIKIPFTGKYAEPGQLVAFELTKDLDLNSIKNNARMAGESLMMSDPGMISSVLDHVADSLPAKDYVFVFWGHGEGFDFDVDFPKEWRAAPAAVAKLQNVSNIPQASAAILYDEWTLDLETAFQEGLNMYEFMQEVENSKIKHFKGLYFHNCHMGNFEALSEVYTVADYMIASEHKLASDGTLISNLVKELYKKDNFQDAVEASLDDSEKYWKKTYKEEEKNGDLSLLKSSEISSFFPIFKNIAKRLKTLYKVPEQKEIIDYAVVHSYFVGGEEWYYSGEFNSDAFFFVSFVAQQTGDDSLIAYAKELKQAFDRLVIKKIEAHYNEEYGINSFSQSILLTPNAFYNGETMWDYTRKDAYENTTFHKKTGWGDFLKVLTGIDEFFDDGDENNSEDEE